MADPQHLSARASDAAWALVVELRTGLPQLRAALDRGDMRATGRCLDLLQSKAIGSATLLRHRWPDLADKVNGHAESLRRNGEDQAAWEGLHSLADELEGAILPGWDVPAGNI